MATVPGRDLNSGPLSFDVSSLLTELMRPDKGVTWKFMSLQSSDHNFFFFLLCPSTINLLLSAVVGQLSIDILLLFTKTV